MKLILTLATIIALGFLGYYRLRPIEPARVPAAGFTPRDNVMLSPEKDVSADSGADGSATSMGVASGDIVGMVSEKDYRLSVRWSDGSTQAFSDVPVNGRFRMEQNNAELQNVASFDGT